MHKYLKAIFHILKNYHLYSIPILLYETLFYFKHNNSVNKFKYLKTKEYDLFIMNDPLKKNDDLLKLILKVKKIYKKCYIILINIDDEKIKTISNNLKLIESFTVSKNRNIFFCGIE